MQKKTLLFLSLIALLSKLHSMPQENPQVLFNHDQSGGEELMIDEILAELELPNSEAILNGSSEDKIINIGLLMKRSTEKYSRNELPPNELLLEDEYKTALKESNAEIKDTNAKLKIVVSFLESIQPN